MYLSSDSSGFDGAKKSRPVNKKSKAYQTAYRTTRARLKGRSPVYAKTYSASYGASYADQLPKIQQRMRGMVPKARSKFAQFFTDSLPAAMSSILMQEGAQPGIPGAAFTSEYAPAGTDAFSPRDDLAPSMQRQYPVVAVRGGRTVGLQDSNGDMLPMNVAPEPSFFERHRMPLVAAAALGALFILLKRK